MSAFDFSQTLDYYKDLPYREGRMSPTPADWESMSREEREQWDKDWQSYLQKINTSSGVSGQGNPNDQWYWDAIAQYKGSSFYDELASNPYLRYNNAEFSPNIWQSLGSSLFSDNSARDAYYADLKAKANQWYSERIGQIRQQNYETPANQVSLNKAAGINPDLGASLSAPAAQNDTSAVPGIDMNNNGDSSALKDIASVGFQFISSVVGFAQNLQSLRAGNLANVGQDIKNHMTAKDFALSMIIDNLELPQGKSLSDLSPEDLDSLVLDASSKMDFSGFSASTRKYMKKYFNQFKFDGRNSMKVATAREELLKHYASNRLDSAQIMSHDYWDKDFNVMIRKVGDTVTKYNDLMYRLQYDSSKLHYDEDKKYFGYKDDEGHNVSVSGAIAETLSNKSISIQAKQAALAESMWTDIYDWLKSQDNTFANVGLLLLPIFRSMISNFNLHYTPKSRSNSESHSMSKNGRTDTYNSSSYGGFGF